MGREDAEVTVRIRYISKEIEKLRYVDGRSDWIDLRCAKETVLKQGEAALIPLGVAMELPEGYEAHVVARSSSYRKTPRSSSIPRITTETTAGEPRHRSLIAVYIL